MKIGRKGGFDLEGFGGFHFEGKDRALLVDRDEERFANRKVIAAIEDGCGFGPDDQGASERFSRDGLVR